MGWSVLETSHVNDHPVRANFGGLRHHLFDGAATPPCKGGEYVFAVVSKLSEMEARVLLPLGEGGPHPALRATLSQRERDMSEPHLVIWTRVPQSPSRWERVAAAKNFALDFGLLYNASSCSTLLTCAKTSKPPESGWRTVAFPST